MKNKEKSVFFSYNDQIKDAINDLKTKGRRHRQIPNILTLLRLTAPCFIIPAAALGNIPLVLGLTAAFSFTDALDGFIARTWKLTSELGAALDAVTDKVFASTLLLAASFTNPILLCNLGLESIIAGITVYKRKNDLPMESTKIGKLKTWFLFPLIGLELVSSYFNLNNILNPLMIITTIMQAATVASYAVPIMKNSKENTKQEENELVLDNDIIEDTELVKEKINNISNTSHKLVEENESIKQLKELKEFLISEKEFLEQETKENNYQKSKKR